MGPNEIIGEKDNSVLDFLFYWQRPIRPGDLAHHLDIKHSTLNSILKKLEQKGYVTWEKYGPVKLTDKGLEAASHISNHHFIIERYLLDTLDISPDMAHKEALHLAGVISCELIEAICRRLGISHDKIQSSFCNPRDYNISESFNISEKKYIKKFDKL